MEKLKSSLTNMVLVLVGVSLAIGAILAYVNHVTEGPISQKAQLALAQGIKNVMGAEDLKVDDPEERKENIDGKEAVFVLHHCRDKQGKYMGAAVESTTGGFAGDLKVLVGFDTEGRILGYTILQTSETPGLGAKADKWFQKGGKGDVIGKNPSEGELHVSKDDKNGNAIDAITASTITSRAFLKAINTAHAVYMENDIDAASGASQVNQQAEGSSTH